ncbi:MAG TPA: UPF0280 family protein [Actinobacteria bacterium]|nr:UPF0280 family protein [Actinomycetota bacterium]
MDNGKDLNIDRFHVDRSIYRKNISLKDKYCYRLKYKYTDLFITSDRDILKELEAPVLSFYKEIGKVSLDEPVFEKSLVPVRARSHYPVLIKKMCRAARMFGIGPMAAVAGAVCDRIAESIAHTCRFLMIENGGDVYIKSDMPVEIGLYSGNKYFSDRLNIKIDAEQTPCGICSSSGSMGHSLSLGRSDLVTVMSDSAILADAAATAIANSIKEQTDIKKAISRYKKNKEIKGLVIIKGDRIGIWGVIQIGTMAK